MHHYQFYGLQIASAFELPEASGTEPEVEGQYRADLTIVKGQVPAEVPDFVDMADAYELGKDSILLAIPRVGRFWMRGGSEMIVDPHPLARMEEIRIYVLGMGMGAILHQRNMLALHGSAVEIDGVAVGFLGESGTGKSTMAALLGERGHKIVSDDVLVISFTSDGSPMVHPGLPTLKVWPDVMEQIDTYSLLALPSLVKKRAYRNDLFLKQPIRLSKLYLLEWLLPRAAASEVDDVPAMEVPIRLLRNLYRPELVSTVRHQQNFMLSSLSVARSAVVKTFRRSSDFSSSLPDEQMRGGDC